MTVIPPNYTLYIRGLDDKRSKKGLLGTHKDLKECLYFLFSQHGRVLDVVCLKTMKQRGQAFVCFNEIEEASAAMRSLQGFPLFEKPMIIQYAKDKSNVIKIREGTILTRSSQKRAIAIDEVAEARKRIKQMEEDENTNELLFISNLPPTTTEESLVTLFQNCTGYKEVRMVPGKTDIAFVEFLNADDASNAKQVLDGFQVSESNKMKVQFARR